MRERRPSISVAVDDQRERMHKGEVAISDEVVRRLVDQQFGSWASGALTRPPPSGTDNQLFRLGEDLPFRMPRIEWAA